MKMMALEVRGAPPTNVYESGLKAWYVKHAVACDRCLTRISEYRSNKQNVCSSCLNPDYTPTMAQWLAYHGRASSAARWGEASVAAPE